jgi:hypothetical protein
LIDYNNIYLIVNKNTKDEGNNEIIYYKLELLKLKKNNTLSRRNRNIINKYLFMKIGLIIKDFYIINNINVDEDILKNSLDYLEGFNLMNVLNSVMPDNIFFESLFNPYIKYESIDLSNPRYLGIDMNLDNFIYERDIFIPINFDFRNENNVLERKILFS